MVQIFMFFENKQPFTRLKLQKEDYITLICPYRYYTCKKWLAGTTAGYATFTDCFLNFNRHILPLEDSSDYPE